MRASNPTSPLLATALAAILLSACNPAEDPRSAGQKVDDAVAKVEQKSDEAIAKAEQKTEEIKADAQGAMAGAKDAAKDTAGKVASKVEDAAITVSVNAELAKDPALSALKINVDTEAGRVILRGSAPDAQARSRATELASAVKGVVSVDNQLEVRS